PPSTKIYDINSSEDSADTGVVCSFYNGLNVGVIGGTGHFNSDYPLNFSVGGTAETWNTLTLANGWTNIGGVWATSKYRKVASPPSCVQVIFACNAGTKADGTTVATLPAGYRPANTQAFPVAIGGSVGVPVNPQVLVDSSGNIKCNGVSACTNMEFQALVSLDA